MTEDLDLYLMDFGVNCTAGAVTFKGILDTTYAEALGMASSNPILACKAEDVATAALGAGDALSVAGTDYTVREVQPDGTGMATLVLELA